MLLLSLHYDFTDIYRNRFIKGSTFKCQLSSVTVVDITITIQHYKSHDEHISATELKNIIITKSLCICWSSMANYYVI